MPSMFKRTGNNKIKKKGIKLRFYTSYEDIIIGAVEDNDLMKERIMKNMIKDIIMTITYSVSMYLVCMY